MKVTKFCLWLAPAVLSTVALAEDPTAPRLRPTPPVPVEEPAVTAPAAPPTEGLGLIPEAPEPAKKPKGQALKEPEKEKPDRTTAAENELGARVRLRELTIKVRQDPKVAAEWDRANSARTDYEKREALKSYYKQLYDRIVKLDPSLDKRVAELRTKSLHRLAETRVDPTEPIDPTERNNGRE